MSDRFDHKLKHTLESKADEADASTDSFRRIELITGPGNYSGRRRHWSSDDKARILLESLQPGANVSDVARRNGLSPQQLFGWRREVREAEPVVSPVRKRGRPKKGSSGTLGTGTAPTHFAAIVIAPAATAATAPASPPPPPPTGASSGTIEITIGDAVVRVRGQVDMALLTAVLRAVRRAS
jgi:transposase